MDELSHVFDDLNSKKTRNTRKVSKNERKRKLSSIESSDDGIGLSSDSHNSLNDSIAQRIKRRNTNKLNENSKQFDSGFFFERVVDQIADKYKNNSKDDAIIDIENLEITDKTGVMEKRIRTKFGYFAENTLEELRKTSFRDKSLIMSPIVESTPDVTHSTPKSKPNKSNKNSKTSEKIGVKQNPKKTVSSLRNDLTNYMPKNSLQAKPQSLPVSIISRNEIVFQEDYGSDASEELEDNHPLVRYESRELWTDNVYQTQCLRSAIEMLKNDQNGLFKDALKRRAMETLNLPVLPSGPNLIPRIIFNRKGEPVFEFYFKSIESPLDVTEELTHINKEILELTQIVYDLIRLNPSNQRRNGRQINNEQRRQVKYK